MRSPTVLRNLRTRYRCSHSHLLRSRRKRRRRGPTPHQPSVTSPDLVRDGPRPPHDSICHAPRVRISRLPENAHATVLRSEGITSIPSECCSRAMLPPLRCSCGLGPARRSRILLTTSLVTVTPPAGIGRNPNRSPDATAVLPPVLVCNVSRNSSVTTWSAGLRSPVPSVLAATRTSSISIVPCMIRSATDNGTGPSPTNPAASDARTASCYHPGIRPRT